MAERVRQDALPEHSTYVDTGCSLAPACLSCPFPECRYEEGASRRASLAHGQRQLAQVIDLHTIGKRPIEIAAELGLSKRMVQRYLRRERDTLSA